MNGLPIRVRLTVAFGLAMLMMLGSAALFVYLRLLADLDERIDVTLESRVSAIVDAGAVPSLGSVALEDPEEAFVQLLSPSGEVLDSVGTIRGPALRADEAAQAAVGPVDLERDLPGVDGRARLIARPGPRNDSVVVVGQSLVDRNDALGNVVSSFALGGAAALLLASLVGYGLATAAMRPVEAMRRRASEVSFRSEDEGLPVPVAHDEIRRLAQTLNEMLTRLRTAFEREGRFVADASHELRTPIAIIKTELEGALQTAIVGSDVHASLVLAAEECDRLGQLAEDMLVIARAADGHLPLLVDAVSTRIILEGARDRFTDRATRRGREITVECPHGLIVHADAVRLRQVLGNLVENALRHGEGEIALRGRSVTGGVEIDVCDEGPGLPTDVAPRAFERFSRGDRSRSSDGVGLGLAIVAGIVEAHGGSATVVPTAPTTVRLSLPDPS